MRSLLLLAIAACAHTPNLPLRPDPSPPAGSTVETITARDGTQLLARTWKPASEPKAAVVIMHGLKDYSARYASLAGKLVTAGYAVYAFDLRGHGRSAGPRVAPDSWDDYVDDLDRFLAVVEQREPGKPVFLFGHSMGGAIAARAAEIHQPRLAGLLLSGPALAADAPPLLLAATRMTGFFMPNVAALKLPNENFSSDPANEAVMDRDELIEQSAAPAHTAAGLIEGMHAIWRDVDLLTMPLVAMHGTADKLTAPSGSRALVETAPATDKTLVIYEGYYHDLVHEPAGKGAKVEDDIVAWLGAHTGGPALAPRPIYTGHLTGDPRGWTQALELGAGFARGASTNGWDGEFALHLARPRPIGFAGSLTANVERAQQHYSVALRPLGMAARHGGAAIGIDIGAALVTHTTWTATGGIWAEVPAGPFHLGVRAEGYNRLAGESFSENWDAIGSLRFGGDRCYWPHARAGIGPALVGGVVGVAGVRTYFVGFGLSLYGVD